LRGARGPPLLRAARPSAGRAVRSRAPLHALGPVDRARGPAGRDRAHHGRHRGPARLMVDKPWGGRFTEGADAGAERFTASLGFDRRLWPQDIAGSIAWAAALAPAGVLRDDER